MSNAFLKLLKDKKVADAYQFYASCNYKLYFAETSFEALQNIIGKFQNDEENILKKVYSDVSKTGTGIYKSHKNFVNFLGVEMSTTVAMDKLTVEIIGLLHNFFDTYAQWINCALLGEDALPIKKATLINLSKKIQNYPEYASDFVKKLITLPTTPQYLYIADFNNTLKHRYQIYVTNRFDLFSLSGEVSIPPFRKDGRVHIKEEAITVLKNSIEFCKQLLSESQTFVQHYYTLNECKYVSHRIYNPKTYMLFNSREDFDSLRFPQNHYYFIEVDPNNILNEYHIMLCCDRMNVSENKSIECFNSDYPIIMLRETVGNNIVGILKPIDNEEFKINDDHELQYRKYLTIRDNYKSEMFAAICRDTDFTYHPYLSDMTGHILKNHE